jgi:hypothetical protein
VGLGEEEVGRELEGGEKVRPEKMDMDGHQRGKREKRAKNKREGRRWDQKRWT